MPRAGRIGPRHTNTGGIWSLTDQQQEKGAGSWVLPLGTLANPATSATALRNSGITTNGTYYYSLPSGGSTQLWTDFNTWSNYSFVLITRLSSADHLQYLTSSRNTSDLTTATTTAPTRSAKISDTDINHIISTNTVRWVVGSNKQVFYRHNDSWTSDFGSAGSCSYSNSYYNAWASASNSPSWTSFSAYTGACGGGQGSSDWLILTGIHANDSNYTGAYIGGSGGLTTAPAAYTTATSSGWGNPGYIFLSW